MEYSPSVFYTWSNQTCNLSQDWKKSHPSQLWAQFLFTPGLMSVYIPPIYTQMTDLMKQRAKVKTSLFLFMFRILKPKTPVELSINLHIGKGKQEYRDIRAKSPKSFTLSWIISLLLNTNVGHVEIMWIYVTCIYVQNIYLTLNTLCYGSSLDWSGQGEWFLHSPWSTVLTSCLQWL